MGDTANIFEAAANGDLKTVTHLVNEKKVDVNSRVTGGETALMKACANGHVKVIEFLVGKGANVNQVDKWGYSALLWALDRNVRDLNVFRYLVEHNANVNAKDKQRGYTPLHWAAEHGDLETAKYLVKKGAKVLEKTNKGETPAHLAASNDHTDLLDYFIDEQGVHFDIFEAAERGYTNAVRYFIDKRKKTANAIDRDGWTVLHRAAAGGNVDTVKYLVEEKGVSVNANSTGQKAPATPLRAAAEKGHVDVVTYLVEAGADVNVADIYGKTALKVATSWGHTEVVKYLAEKGADVDARDVDGRTPLYSAAGNGYLELVKYLVEEKRVDAKQKDNYGNTMLHASEWVGALDVVKYLVEEKGLNVNVKDYEGNTPLLESVQRGKLEVFRYLLEERFADFRLANNEGKTCLHEAAIRGYMNIVKMLVDRGADINGKDRNGRTPLYEAAGGLDENGHLDVVKYFVDVKKADVRQKDSSGNTLLHAAEWNGSLDVVKYLVEEKGLDVNVKDNDGNTPLAECIQRGKIHVAKYLESKGARWNRRRRRNAPVVEPDAATNSAYRHYSVINCVAQVARNIPHALLTTFSSESCATMKAGFDSNSFAGLLALLNVGIGKLFGFRDRKLLYTPAFEGLVSPTEFIEERIDPNATSAIRESFDFFGYENEF